MKAPVSFWKGWYFMKLVEAILKNNPCYTAGRKITVKGLMLHSVGCPQPNASVFMNNWNKSSYNKACVHAFIDGNDGTVYQTLPWNHRGWHCASGSKGSGNNTHIGVEMCEPACIKYTGGSSFTCSDKATAKAVAKRTYQAAVELFAMLCKKYNLNPTADGVILSHKEGYKRGIASNHGDPEHLWSGLGLSYTMDGFRKDVKAAMNGTASAPSTETTQTVKNLTGYVEVIYKGSDGVNVRKTPAMGDNVDHVIHGGVFTVTGITADGEWYRLKSGGYITTNKKYVSYRTQLETTKDFKAYKVRVSVNDLNIRKGPGTNYAKTGKYTGKGTFTIVGEKIGEGSTKGWGKLKSNAGWISLDYTTRV